MHANWVVALAEYEMSVFVVASTKLDRRERLVRSNASLSTKSNTGSVYAIATDRLVAHIFWSDIVVACLQVIQISQAII